MVLLPGRKKNDRAQRRKETRFKFLMVNGGGSDGKRESVYGKRKSCSITETVRPRAECFLYSSSDVYQTTCRGYFPSIHES